MTPSLRAKAVRLKTEDLTLDVDIRFYSNLISARFHTLWVKSEPNRPVPKTSAIHLRPDISRPHQHGLESAKSRLPSRFPAGHTFCNAVDRKVSRMSEQLSGSEFSIE